VTVFQETIQDVGGKGPVEIARCLVALGVEKLICGGIQNHHKDWLTRKGITVVDNQKGVAREIVQRLLKDWGKRIPASKDLAMEFGSKGSGDRDAYESSLR